jgi:hypothetical protein
MLRTLTFSILLVSISVTATAADGIKTPQQQFDGYPTRLDDIPAGWSTTNPILLRVCFNLKHPVNSPAANAFLRELHDTVSGLEFGVDIRIERMIRPTRFAYCNSLIFENWETNRRYETSAAFLKYYQERWKPAVTDAEEHLSVLDIEAAGDE